jgi:hypothetical protein
MAPTVHRLAVVRAETGKPAHSSHSTAWPFTAACTPMLGQAVSWRLAPRDAIADARQRRALCSTRKSSAEDPAPGSVHWGQRK